MLKLTKKNLEKLYSDVYKNILIDELTLKTTLPPNCISFPRHRGNIKRKAKIWHIDDFPDGFRDGKDPVTHEEVGNHVNSNSIIKTLLLAIYSATEYLEINEQEKLNSPEIIIIENVVKNMTVDEKKIAASEIEKILNVDLRVDHDFNSFEELNFSVKNKSLVKFIIELLQNFKDCNVIFTPTNDFILKPEENIDLQNSDIILEHYIDHNIKQNNKIKKEKPDISDSIMQLFSPIFDLFSSFIDSIEGFFNNNDNDNDSIFDLLSPSKSKKNKNIKTKKNSKNKKSKPLSKESKNMLNSKLKNNHEHNILPKHELTPKDNIKNKKSNSLNNFNNTNN